jgi:hypothetical protein
MNRLKKVIPLFLAFGLFLCGFPLQAQLEKTDLLVIGGGASGTTAGIQAARMGVETLVIEKTPWLGGMLTAAGVSAIDGNHQLPSGLWGEFRQKLYDYYGGPQAVETGWVSNTLFEPSVGNQMLQELANEEKLTVWYKTEWQRVEKKGNLWQVEVRQGRKKRLIEAKILIDATELGDVMAAVGVPYDLGMDSREASGEAFAPEEANDIVQDLTYVVTLKDFGPGSDRTIKEPKGYKPEEFACACDTTGAEAEKSSPSCIQMINYGRLPNNKYMINWPRCGNDIYLNIVEKTPAEREEALKEARLHSLRFVYYLQTELGFRNLGIAENEYPTKDNLPMIPYHRESRRLQGMVRLNVNHLAEPYEQQEALYRTGIAVGDYPIDHHHLKNPDAPEIEFIKIKIPSYNIPLGALIPAQTNGLIVAEKSISVSNIINGATRLQPVVLGIGQAAGALAAVAIRQQRQPQEVSIREVQQALLDANAYLMPFIDVKPADAHFAAIQRIGATGILKGQGVPYKWANQTWFYPQHPLSEYELLTGLKDYYPGTKDIPASGAPLSLRFMLEVLKAVQPALSYEKLAGEWDQLALEKDVSPDLILNRREAAVLLDYYLNPFAAPLHFNGSIKQ